MKLNRSLTIVYRFCIAPVNRIINMKQKTKDLINDQLNLHYG